MPLSIASVVLLVGGFALVFFYAPNDADQGFVQKIFYLHVPLAIVALCGFVAGGVYGDRASCARATARWDLRSYVAIHLSLILGVGVLVTGSIWAQGVVGPLVGVGRADARLLPDRLPALRLLPAAALLDRGPGAPGALRLGVRDHRRRLRAAQLPRGARSPSRSRTRACSSTTGGSMPGSMRLTFLVCAARHGAAVRDAVEVRAGLQARDVRGCVRCKRTLAGDDDGWVPVRRTAAPQL